MKLWVAIVEIVFVVACGKGKEADKAPAGGPADKADKPPGGDKPGDKPPSGGPAPTKASVQSGELVVSGAFTGTFRWKEDLNLDCTWIPDLKGGGMDITLTDGAKTFMAFQIKNANGVHEIEMTSGALKSASMLTSPTGFTMTGSDDRTHMSVTIDADVASKEGTKAHLKGKFELACVP